MPLHNDRGIPKRHIHASGFRLECKQNVMSSGCGVRDDISHRLQVLDVCPGSRKTFCRLRASVAARFLRLNAQDPIGRRTDLSGVNGKIDESRSVDGIVIPAEADRILVGSGR